MFEKIRQAVAVLSSGRSGAAATAPTKIVTADPLVPVPSPDPLVLQVRPATRADLIEIKVDGLDAAKQNAVWLTKGVDRSQPATAVRLVDCTSDHLKNIVVNKPGLSPDYRRVIESILEDRGETLPDATDLHPDFTD